jgi:hypothetical protein
MLLQQCRVRRQNMCFFKLLAKRNDKRGGRRIGIKPSDMGYKYQVMSLE